MEQGHLSAAGTGSSLGTGTLRGVQNHSDRLLLPSSWNFASLAKAAQRSNCCLSNFCLCQLRLDCACELAVGAQGEAPAAAPVAVMLAPQGWGSTQSSVPEPQGLSAPLGEGLLCESLPGGSQCSRRCSFLPVVLLGTEGTSPLHRCACNEGPSANQWLEQSAAALTLPRFLLARN